MRKNPQDKKFTLTASVRVSLIERIVQEARRRGVTVSDVVNEALSRAFDNTKPESHERLRE